MLSGFMIIVQKAHGVEFYSDENPGPLGKPSAQKITDDIEVRNWDPTDPDSKNPWRNYTESGTSTSSNKNTNSSINSNVIKKNEID